MGSFFLAKYIDFDKNIELLLGNVSCHLAADLHCSTPDLDWVCLLVLHPVLTLERSVAFGCKLAVIEEPAYSLLASSTGRSCRLGYAALQKAAQHLHLCSVFLSILHTMPSLSYESTSFSETFS